MKELKRALTGELKLDIVFAIDIPMRTPVLEGPLKPRGMSIELDVLHQLLPKSEHLLVRATEIPNMGFAGELALAGGVEIFHRRQVIEDFDDDADQAPLNPDPIH